MTSWHSSSSRARAPGLGPLAIALVALAALAACRHGPRDGASLPRLVVFPVQNGAGVTAPVRGIGDALEAGLAARGLNVVPRKDLETVLANHRIRYTGGVDRDTAKILREELSADQVLIPTLEQYAAEDPPKVALDVRISSLKERPMVLWASSSSRAGNDAPGLLGLGLVADVGRLQRTVVDDIVGAIDGWFRKGARGPGCDAGRFVPRRSFRAPILDDVGRRTVAVLPFLNRTPRRGAGDVLVNQFVELLARSGSFEVVEPGVVRDELLDHRIVLEGGVSVDTAVILLELMEADLVLAGDVQVFTGPAGAREPPGVEFTAFMLDRESGDLVWSSASNGEGNDGVYFFGAGRVYTTSGLSCRMARGTVDELIGDRGPLPPTRGDAHTRPQWLRTRSRMAQFQRAPGQSTARDSEEKARAVRARSVNVRRGSTEPAAPSQQGDP
jgi:hypothetical protein